MHIQTQGHGPALVMLHGWGMHAGAFAPLCEQLQQHYTLHLVDLPGHGHSRTEILALDTCVDELAARFSDTLWLGWSLGGLLALRLAQRYPDHCRALVMLAASPRFTVSADWPNGMPADIFQTFADELRSNWRRTLDRFLMLEAQGSEHLRQELSFLRECLYQRGEPSLQALNEGLLILQNTDLRDTLSAMSSASLWISGHRDRLVSLQAMQAAAAQCRNAEFLSIQGAGHAPFLTHPSEVAAAITAFFQRATPLHSSLRQ